MINIKNVSTIPGSDAFLLTTESGSILIDSGFDFCAEKMAENIKKELSGKALDYIFLTHSHYDHASGVPACKAVWKDVKVVSSEYAKKILSKPTALQTIKEMNESAAHSFGVSDYEFKHESIPVDIAVKDGDIIDAAGLKFQVLETPGHTKCTIAFYCTEEKLLISNETIGVQLGDSFTHPCCLVGYQMTVDSIEKVMKCGAEKMLVPHHGVESISESGDLLNDSMQSVKKLKNDILSLYDSGKTNEEIEKYFYDTLYTEETKKAQPEAAFLLNTKIMVAMVIKEFRK